MSRCYGTGEGGDGGCSHRTEGATLQHHTQLTTSHGEAVAAGTGRAGDAGGDQAGNESAAGGGPQRSRWPGSGDGGAASGEAAKGEMTAGVSCGDRRPGDQSYLKS